MDSWVMRMEVRRSSVAEAGLSPDSSAERYVFYVDPLGRRANSFVASRRTSWFVKSTKLKA